MRRFARSRTTRFGGRGYKPARTWIGSEPVLVVGAGLQTQANVLAIEAPALPAVLTSAPPEDLTILAVRGYFSVELGEIGSFDLALMVVDSTWTPSGTWLADSDKRLLWWKRIYVPATTGTVPDVRTSEMSWFEVDIKPKVKLEDGKRLVMVAWSASGGGAVTAALRLLTQRAGRR